MQPYRIEVDQAEAERLARAYRNHRHFETDVDREIRRTYEAIAKGKVVIRALQSVPAAGVGVDGLPKLALVRADAPHCFLSVESTRTGAVVRMSHTREGADNVHAGRKRFAWPRDVFGEGLLNPSSWMTSKARAITPIIPVHLRPRTALDQYHILFEAEWRDVVPIDPMLLRRIGRGDLWVVCAAWDLTEVERAALQARVQIN